MDFVHFYEQPTGEATLTGSLCDQAELYGVLLKLYHLNLTLIAVQRTAAATSTSGDASATTINPPLLP
ncbi:MAG: hypothetical protein R3C14_49635 [Caldilineaceae bacterium]